jgi:hypothetical protein
VFAALSVSMKNITILISIILLSSCHPYRGFIESEFTLSPESPLPSWYKVIPEGYSRDDLTIKIRYYAPPLDVDDTVFWVESSWRNTIYKASGKSERHPEFYKWAQEDWKNRHYPSYVNITIEGKTEIIEHKKMEPIFYISTKKAVTKAMSVSQ